MKTHFKKLRNPDYIGSWDLTDSNGNFVEKIATIQKVGKKMVHDGQGGQDECIVIELKEFKPLIANATNLKQIKKLANSPYIEDWIGLQICLHVQKVKAFGEIHDALRVKKSEKVKEQLSEERFKTALEALKSGSTTVTFIETNYQLTTEQNERLQATSKSLASK
jgi:hypothetical protein